MGLKCRIGYTGKIATAYNEDGTPSRLYQEALAFTGDQQEALSIWATSTLEEFEQASGKVNTNDNVTLDEVLNFYNDLASQGESLSIAEKFEVKQFMANNKFRKLSELRDTLNNIFRKDGKIVLDTAKAIESGLYNTSEIKGLDLEKISELLIKIDGQLRTDDFTVEPSTENFKYSNSAIRTVFGNFEKTSEDKVLNDLENLIDDLSSKEEFYQKISDLEYPEFVESFYNDKEFAQSVMDKFKGLKKVPILQFEGNKVAVATSSTFNTVKNTIRTDINPISVEADSDYLNDIDEDIWSRAQKSIKGILSRIEKDAIGMGIDIIGMKDKSADRNAVLEFMTSLNTLVQDAADRSISTQTIRGFAEAHDKLIPKGKYLSTERLPEKYKGLTIVKLHTALSDDVLFEEHGLIKIEENLYHKIKKQDKNDVYQYLYQELMDNNIEIPTRFTNKKDLSDPLNKTKVLDDISTYIAGRKTGLNIRNNEEVSLYQVAFNHNPLPLEHNGSDEIALEDLTIAPDYLRTEFVSDFYEYMLEEKFKDSLVYREKLSKFEINDRDIVLKEPIDNVEDLKYTKELKDYFRLKRDNNVKYLVPSRKSGVSEDLWSLNNVASTQEYLGKDLTKDSGYLITAPNKQNYINYAGKLYKKALQNNDSHLYAEVILSPDNLYYKTESVIKFDKQEAQKVMSRYNKRAEAKTVPITSEEALRKAGMKTPFMTRLLEKSKQVAKEARRIVTGSNFNIIGEQGAETLDRQEEIKYRIGNLLTAKDMQDKGIDAKNIKLSTGWEQMNGEWMYEVEDVFLADNFEPEIGKEYNYLDIVKPNEFTKAYPQLKSVKIKFNNDGTNSFTEDGGTINLDAEGLTRGVFGTREQPTSAPLNSRGFTPISKSSRIERILNHESAHFAQRQEGFYAGGSPDSIVRRGYELAGVQEEDDFNAAYLKVYNKYKEDNLTQSDKNILLAILLEYKPIQGSLVRAYNNLAGEAVARNVERRMDLSTQEKLNSLLKDTEIDVREEDKIFLRGTTASDKIFEKNLVEFIRAKGVQVVTDNKAMTDALKDLNLGNFVINLQDKQVGAVHKIKIPNNEILTFLENNQGKSIPIESFLNFRFNIGLEGKVITIIKTENEYTEAAVDFDDLGKIKGIEISYGKDVREGEERLRSGIITTAISHEIQHVFDTNRRKNSGSSPEFFEEIISQLLPTLPEGIRNYSEEDLAKLSYGLYWASAGEVRARRNSVEENGVKYESIFQTVSEDRVIENDDFNFEENINIIKNLTQQDFDYYRDVAEKSRQEFTEIINIKANFLQTPAGDVLGFEKNGIIYLDENQLNNTTTIHELIHVFQSMIDTKAKKGDKKAQAIIAKRKELFQSAVDGWKGWHKNSNNEKRRDNENSEFDREILQMRGLQRELPTSQSNIGLLRESFGREVQEALEESGGNTRGNTIARISRKLQEITSDIDRGTGINDSGEYNKGYTRISLENNYGEEVISKLEKIEFRDAIAEDILSILEEEKLSPEAQQLKDTLGLDLSSPAYAQMPGESSEDWNTRLLKEVEAYITAPEISAKLEELKNNDPSLWQKITDFIKQLTDWLKSQIGLSDYQGDIMDMTKEEYISALGISVLKDDYSSPEKAQEYFTRNADRLPLTLSVFSRPEFVKMQGTNVNPITVLNSLNQSGIKQVEKDLIRKVIEDNYQGQKKISYDELEATVRANIMPLERIFTSSFADYGMNNLGEGDYGNANTIILNAPIEHGVTGHFSGDFKASGRKNIKYIPKQLNNNTWVAVEEGYEDQANDNNIYQFVGTAGTKEAVETWIENYTGTDSYKVGQKIETYKGKGTVLDVFEDGTPFIRYENGEESVLRRQDREEANINKGMFGHIRVWQDGDIFHVAELQSDYFQKNKAKDYLVYENEEYTKGIKRIKDEITDNLAERQEKGEITYAQGNKMFIDELIKKQAKFEQDFFNSLTTQEKQFIASQKEWEKRMVREAIKEASLSGATELRFPTPYTLSVIEGYISKGEEELPYTIIKGDVEVLVKDDVINYLDKNYKVLAASNSNITVGLDDGLSELNFEWRTLDLDKKLLGKELQKDYGILWRYDYQISEKIPEGAIRLIESILDIHSKQLAIGKEYIKRSGGESLGFYKGPLETLGQPSTYKKSSSDNFDIVKDLSDVQQTVARKYEEIAGILKKERGDNFEIVTDGNGFDWYSTKISPEEVNNPVVAFNIIGTKGAQQNQDLLSDYKKAIDLEEQGATSSEIEMQTGWFKEAGDWKYFSKETLKNFKIKSNFVVKAGTFNYTDVIDNKELIKMYPSLKNVKIEFYEGTREAEKSKRNANAVRSNGDILVNLDRLDYGTEGGSRTFYRGVYPDNRGFSSDSKNLGSQVGGVIMHETQHHIQEEENFPRGGGLYTLFDKVSKYTKQDDPRLGIVRDNLAELLKNKKNLPESQVKEMTAVVTFLNDMFAGKMNQDTYKLLLGEVEARFLQNLHKEGFDETKTYFQLREEFEMAENIFERDKYVVRGEDLTMPSSESYASIQNKVNTLQSILDSQIEFIPLYPESESDSIYEKMDNCE